MDFTYRFPAIRGKQAQKEYYVAMVPLGMLPKLFPPYDEYVLPEYRAQRKINKNRIPTIKQYILNNRDSYVFSALSASVDGKFSFLPEEDNSSIGVLEVSSDAKLIINDGQHRKAALLEALLEDDSLKEETISIVLYEDLGLKCSQQMFTDLNKNAVKSSNSIAELYDSRDELAIVTRKALANIPFLDRYTDKEKDILGKYSSNFFTLNSFYNANRRVIQNNLKDNTEEFLIKYWNTVVNFIAPWKELDNRTITKVELREQYIISQSVVLQTLGRLGNYFYELGFIDFVDTLSGLENIDWRRNSKMWESRTIRENGRMINNEKAIILTCNIIKETLGIPLNQEELKYEDGFLNGGK